MDCCLRNRNVAIGLAYGFTKVKAWKLVKGMWPKPDSMKDMLATRQLIRMLVLLVRVIPSPTGAALHAMHYHQINVKARQDELLAESMLSLDDLLTPPFKTRNKLDG